MIKFFESTGAPHCPKDKNPAEYILDLIGASDPNCKDKDWTKIWSNSANHTSYIDNINQLITARLSQTSENQISNSCEFAMPWQTLVGTKVKWPFVNY